MIDPKMVFKIARSLEVDLDLSSSQAGCTLNIICHNQYYVVKQDDVM